MKKTLNLLFFFIIISLLNANVVDEHFGRRFKVGLSRFSGRTVKVKVLYGKARLEYNNNSYQIIKKDEVLEFKYKHGNIYYGNIKVENIYIKKEDIITMIGLNNSGNNFSRYRGEFEIIKYKSEIWPVNIITAEEYLYSVVPSEIGFNFHNEAIKAQSVAARTYLYNGLITPKYERFDLMDDTNSQMYLGYERENPKIRNLVNETSNEIITYKDRPINAVYHSTSGGKTANNEDVWKYSKKLSYLRAVNDKGNGKNSPRANWFYKASMDQLKNRFGFEVEKVSISEKKDLRAKNILIEGEHRRKEITGNEFRRIMGYTNIFSTIFKIQKTHDGYLFRGHGSGHGVGMSQWGANGLAKQGKNYKEILNYYYTNIKIKTLKN